jgi:hypothetical protein
MATFLTAVIIFAIAFLGMAIGVLRHKRCLGCSCKAADRIMGNNKQHSCQRDNQGQAWPSHTAYPPARQDRSSTAAVVLNILYLWGWAVAVERFPDSRSGLPLSPPREAIVGDEVPR